MRVSDCCGDWISTWDLHRPETGAGADVKYFLDYDKRMTNGRGREGGMPYLDIITYGCPAELAVKQQSQDVVAEKKKKGRGVSSCRRPWMSGLTNMMSRASFWASSFAPLLIGQFCRPQPLHPSCGGSEGIPILGVALAAVVGSATDCPVVEDRRS